MAMPVLTKETALFKTGQIEADINNAKNKADNYITDITGDGIWVTPSNSKPVNGQVTGTTSGWHISDVIELFKSGVSYIKAYVENSVAKIRIGRSDQGHLILDNNSLDISNGQDVVASFGETVVLGLADSLHQEITPERDRFVYNDKVYAYMSPDKIFAENMEVNSSYYVGEYAIRQTRDRKLVIGRRR